MIKNKKGFTLIELLVVIAILGILSVIGLSSFRASQAKARDAKRKSDLQQLQRALEMYFNDHRQYPEIQGNWGSELRDGETIYMKLIPSDPTENPPYCYILGPNGTSYQIYARLENTEDQNIGGPFTCNAQEYNFGVSSSNTSP
ncbi:type II secretion system protein [Candidatus Microgenomates bacterium]|jgi:prepilin-type N-terminal cleavage/methylation domain-containing protein|nr:MAG: type II secretion system protein [Candidatus Microgenomates bacterium]